MSLRFNLLISLGLFHLNIPGRGNATYFRAPTNIKKTLNLKKKIWFHPTNNRKKKWRSPSQVDLNGTALTKTFENHSIEQVVLILIAVRPGSTTLWYP